MATQPSPECDRNETHFLQTEVEEEIEKECFVVTESNIGLRNL